MSRTIIIVPCFNEAARLRTDRFLAFVRSNPSVSLLMVNDGSVDATRAVLQRMSAEAPQNIQLLELPCNVGKAEAVRRGCCLALKENPEFIGYWDADLAAPLEASVRFREVFERNPEVHVVIGARIPLLGHRVERSRWRYWSGRLFAWCAASLLGLPIYDTQAGHKLFRVTDRLRGIVSAQFHSKWIFDVELLARWIGRRDQASLDRARNSIYEFPLESWVDVPGSKLKAMDCVRAFLDLAVIGWDYLCASQPRRITNHRTAIRPATSRPR